MAASSQEGGTSTPTTTGEEGVEFRVVKNHEEQYSVWASSLPMPLGWHEEGKKGTKAECLKYIGEVWTDMRPLSLRRHMDEVAARKTSAPPIEKVLGERREAADMATPTAHFSDSTPPSPLVMNLCRPQPVEIIRYRDPSTGEPSESLLREAVSRKYVLVKFTGTKGGTELGLSLTGETCGANYERVPGSVVLQGRLRLDFTPILVVATVELKTFRGTGNVVIDKERR